jgi:hypothetical protein
VEATNSGEIDVIFASTLNRYERDGKEVLTSSEGYPTAPLQIAERWIRGDMIQTGAIAWRREFLASIGGWNHRVEIGDDWELGLRALLKLPRVALAPNVYSVYNHREIGGRAAFKRSPRLLCNMLTCMSDLATKVAMLENEKLDTAIADRIYGLARTAFCVGEQEIGWAALERSHEIRPGFHQGNAIHRTLAQLLGLERKERVFEGLRKILRHDGSG